MWNGRVWVHVVKPYAMNRTAHCRLVDHQEVGVSLISISSLEFHIVLNHSDKVSVPLNAT